MAVKELKIRPYARLLTMLGEQLIKNEQIALAELIKKLSRLKYGKDRELLEEEIGRRAQLF